MRSNSGAIRRQWQLRGVRAQINPRQINPRWMASLAAFASGAVIAIPMIADQPAAIAAVPNATTVSALATASVLANATASPVTDERASEPVLRSASAPRDETHPAVDDVVEPRFNGRPVRVKKTMMMKVTAYSPDERSCGASADGITASGYSVSTNGGRMVAADTGILPLGSIIAVPGYDAGTVVPVLDRGGAIKGNRLDVLFATHEEARRWGVRDLLVTIYEYDDGRPNGFRQSHRRR